MNIHSQKLTHWTWNVSDLSGRILIQGSQSLEMGTEKIVLDASTFSKGIYLFRLTGNHGESGMSKLIIP